MKSATIDLATLTREEFIKKYSQEDWDKIEAFRKELQEKDRAKQRY